jgi:hypothetical protein
MNFKRTYDIAFVGLKQGPHEFNYTVEDQFFSHFVEPEFKNCKAEIKLTLDKHSNFMMFKFEIGGSVQVGCDRCGNALPIALWDEFNTIVKLVDNPDEMNEQEEDPDIFYVSKGESHVNVAEWIFEFIQLSVPFQRMCSIEEMGGPHCNKEVLELLKKMQSEENQPQANDIWSGLNQFKDLDN